MYLFIYLQRDTLTHAAAFQGSFGMNVAFVGLSLAVVDLSPLCWASSEVGELQRCVEPCDFPPCLGFPREGGRRQARDAKRGAVWPRLEHLSPACHWKGAGEGGENKPNHAVPAK